MYQSKQELIVDLIIVITILWFFIRPLRRSVTPYQPRPGKYQDSIRPSK